MLKRSKWGIIIPQKIWNFTMKSACRQHEIVIQTSPKNIEYLVISAAQNKVEEFDTKDAETVALPVDEERNKLADTFYRLEHQEEDLIKKKVVIAGVTSKSIRHLDDYSINRSLRARLEYILFANQAYKVGFKKCAHAPNDLKMLQILGAVFMYMLGQISQV